MVLLLCLYDATAQDGGFDAHGFRLAGADADVRAPLQFLRPGEVDALEWSLGAVVEYASRPLLFEAAGVRTVGLEDLVAVNVAGGFVPLKPLRIDLALPAVLSSTTAGASGGPVAGDLRVSSLIAPFQPDDAGGFGGGLLAALDLPTGDPSRYLGLSGPALTLGLASTFEVDRFTVSGLLGARLAPSTSPADRPAASLGGDTLEGAGSVGVLLSDKLAVGVEATVSLPIDPAVRTGIGIPAVAVASARYQLSAGAYLSAGVGTGLSRGAGASPLRLVFGGGFGGFASAGARDADGDGIVANSDACPDEPETVNGFRDDDGCPDSLPIVEFVARKGPADEPAAAMELTKPDGTKVQGLGRISGAGIPGQVFKLTAKFGACFGAVIEARAPDQGNLKVEVPIVRQDAELVFAVTDAAGRPLSGAEARYLVEDDECAPEDTKLIDGRGVHQVGAGPVQIFVTAPGYGVHRVLLSLSAGQKELVDARLSPAHVALRDGVFDLAKPLTFTSGSASLGDAAQALLGQVASLMLSNDALSFAVTAWAPSGDAAQRLSQQRANAVKTHLESLGVKGTRLTAAGGGAKASGASDWVRIEIAR